MATCHGFQDFEISKEDIKIERQLGNGMFFPVHLALFKGQRVVLKRIYPVLQHDKNDTLKEEDRAMFRFRHPNVLVLFGVMMARAPQSSYYFGDDEYSLVMEFMEYGDLMNVLTKCTVPWPMKVHIILGIISGMNFLCENNVYHKNLSVKNVLLDHNFIAKIADLNFSTFKSWETLSSKEKQRTRQTHTSDLEPLYCMAPEDLELDKKHGEKRASFSFGIVLWITCANQLPYKDVHTAKNLMSNVIGGGRPSLHLLPEDTPMILKKMMQDCWQKEDCERPSFRVMKEKLDPYYKIEHEDKVPAFVLKMQKQMESEDVSSLSHKIQTLHLDSKDLSHDGSSPIRNIPVVPGNGFHQQNIQPAAIGESEEDVCTRRKLDAEKDYHKNGNPIDEKVYDVYSSSQITSKIPLSQPEQSYHGTRTPNHPPEKVPPPKSMSNFAQPKGVNMVAGASLVNTGFPDVDKIIGNAMNMMREPSHLGTTVFNLSQARGIQIGSHNTMNVGKPVKETGRIHAKPYRRKLEDFPATSNHSPFSKTDGKILIDELGKAWKQVARSLDINDADIDTIQHDFYKDGLKEMIYQMIKLWKNRVGNKEASVAAMAKALHDCQEYNLLEKLGNNS